MRRTPTSRQYVPRHIETQVREALGAVPLIALQGPRRSGKFTLAKRVAEQWNLPFFSLEDEDCLDQVEDDPAGFLRDHPKAVIVALQRAPELVRELASTLTRDAEPGRYLVTSSVDLHKRTPLALELGNRMKTFTLLPFSQAEINLGRTPRFLERAFAAEFPHFEMTGPTSDLVERVVAGSYPEALACPSTVELQSWLRTYARTQVEHQIQDIAAVDKLYKLVELIKSAATGAGQLLNLTEHATRLGVDSKTVARWLLLLEHLFVIDQVPAFHCKGLGRLVHSPKLQFIDSGLLTSLLRVDATSIASDRRTIEPLLGCLVYAEVVKAIAQSGVATDTWHYRDKDQVEISLVLEREQGALVGVDVKSGATVKRADFKGLVRLKEVTGKRFACGILLYDGEWIQKMDERLFSMPLKMLWEA